MAALRSEVMSGKVTRRLSVRHGRACLGHPRLADHPYGRWLRSNSDQAQQYGSGRPLRYDRDLRTWMAGTSPAMTRMGDVGPSPQRLQFARQGVGPLGDVAGAEADDEVAGTGDVMNDLGQFSRIRQRDHLAMAMGAQPGDEMIAVNAFDRRLAGRIDLGDDNGIGIVETGTEFLEQRLQPCVAMRLHHGDDLAVGGFTCRFKDSGYLDRMVTVIVDHSDAVPLAGPRETPLHAA